MMKWAIIGALACLGGCTALPEPTPTPTPNDDRNAAVLFEIGRVLPGEYSTADALREDEAGGDLLRLGIRLEPGMEPGERLFSLVQRQGDGPERFFRLGIESSPGSRGLSGFFAPSDRSGRMGRSCALDISLRSDGFTALTDPTECRFGDDSGLLKEIAFDGRRLVIGDRLVSLTDGQALAPDQVHTFFPIDGYTGWAGKRQEASWLRAEPFSIHSGGDALNLVDAGGMPLGVSIQLTLYRVAGQARPLLRLRAFDSESGRIKAESWADPGARRLGLALPDLQIGLERAPQAPPSQSP